MARNHVVRFDDPARPELREVISPDDPRFPAIRRRMWITWGKTLAGYAAMGALCFLALWAFGFSFHLKLGFGLLWLFLPVITWWFCAELALAMNKAVPADPTNPQHKRIMDLVDEAFKSSGLKFKPPVYASPDPRPNAFATGPIHRKAVVAFTAGLLDCNMTDKEIKAVFAHELGHVRNYDVAINSFLGVLSSLLFMIVNAGVSGLLAVATPMRWVSERIGVKWLYNLLTNVIFYVVFQIEGAITRVIQMFVVRSRESGADATGAYITGDPCSLATALQKLVCYYKTHPPKAGLLSDALLDVIRARELMRGLRVIMTIDPLFDTRAEEPKPTSIWGKLKAFWQYLQLTHPPIPERVAELERMNGGACPTCNCDGSN